MSLPPDRCPGFWNSVTSASTNRKMMTHKAKLRKLGFIEIDLSLGVATPMPVPRPARLTG